MLGNTVKDDIEVLKVAGIRTENLKYQFSFDLKLFPLLRVIWRKRLQKASDCNTLFNKLISLGKLYAQNIERTRNNWNFWGE